MLAAGVLTVLVWAVPAAAESTNPTDRPVVDLAAAPRGWVPVDYGKARISIPPSWTILTTEGSCSTSPGGTLLIGPEGKCLPSSSPNVYPTIASLTEWRGSVASMGPPRFVNGIAVYAPGVEALYVVPRLGISLYLSGAYPGAVLSSLTYSPRAVATAPGPSPTVPRAWHRYRWGNVSIAAPQSWALHKASRPDPCANDGALPSAGVTLTDKPPLPISCPVFPVYPADGSSSSPLGVEIDNFARATDVSSGACEIREVHGLRLCLSTGAPYDELVAVVYPPHHRALLVRLGLAGDGSRDRTVLGSLLYRGAAANGRFGLLAASNKLSDRIILRSTHAVAGMPISGFLVVANRGSKTINLTHGCRPSFAVGLTKNPHSVPAVNFALPCSAASFLISPGMHRLAITVETTYSSCAAPGGSSAVTMARCLPGGREPPLPAGTYEAMLVGSGIALPAPHPVAVRLVPPTKGTVTGVFEHEGGPLGTPTAPYATGSVTLTGGDHAYTARIRKDGTFRLMAPAGRYETTGRTAEFGSGQSPCLGPSVLVRPGETLSILVACQLH